MSEKLDKLKHNKEKLFMALNELGANRAEICYSGSGDSGQIDDISLFKDSKAIKDWKGLTISQYVGSSSFKNGGWEEKFELKDLTLHEAFVEFCYSWLSIEHPGFEINEGSEGTIAFDLETQEVEMEHTEFHLSSENYSHSL